MKKIVVFLFLRLLILSPAINQEVLTQEWVNSFNNSSPTSGEIPKIIADSENNLFVCGESHQSLISSFLFTTKFDSSGNIQWQNNYSPQDLDNELSDVVLDNNDNIIIAGASYDENNSQGVIIKYNSQGDTLWTIRHPNNFFSKGNFRDLLVDENQYIYALGARADSDDDNSTLALTLIKVSPDGVILWENTHFANEGDQYTGHQIKLLSDRIIVFATNETLSEETNYVIHQVDFSGQNISTVEKKFIGDYSNYNTIDQEGAIFLGNADEGYKVTKLNLEGDTLWEFIEPVIGVNFPVLGAWLSELQSDGAGGIYISGIHWDDESAHDILTIHLSHLGVPLWSQRYNYQGDEFNDGPLDIFVDDQYVYVVGISQQSFFNYDYILIVYNKETGEEIATARHDNLDVDGAISVFVKDDKIYVSGHSYEEYISTILTLKYRLDAATHTLQLVPLPSQPIDLFPMPFSETFSIKQKEGNLFFTCLEVFDIKGKLIFQKEVTDVIQEVSIPKLSKGNYLLKVTGKEKEHSQIIVKQ